MTSKKGQMRLGVFLNPTGHHAASWLHPGTTPDAGINFQHQLDIVRSAERAKLDFIFLADMMTIRKATPDARFRFAQYVANFDPITMLAALAPMTERIGLVATASTSYYEPFHVARQFASIDHLSKGRVGWNLVTSGNPEEAYNFGRDAHLEHDERYGRAREFAQVVQALWDSYDDDAFVRDRASGAFFDPERMHFLNHKGKHFSVRGPLTMPRPIQGYPVLVQAGGSEAGGALASEFAEVIFGADATIEAAQAFYARVKDGMAQYGRSREHLKIMPGMSIFVGRTEAEADEKFEYLQSRIQPMVSREALSIMLGGVDLTGYDLDDKLPDDLPQTQGSHAHFRNIVEKAKRENLSIREIGNWVAGARGKCIIKGTPEHIADVLEEWFVKDAADGFNLMPAWLPGSLDDVITMVVPELQKRGLFRTEYEGRTLRDNLGLPRPESRYRRHAQAAE